MAIYGTIMLEDISITFGHNDGDTNTITYIVGLLEEGGEKVIKSETFTVPQDKFLKALALAVHNDGMPDWEKDYPDAESIQGKIRWIP